MGRKKAAAADLPGVETPPVPAETPPVEQPSARSSGLSDAIRAAFAALGLEADKSALKNWITLNYPGMVINESSLSATSSTLRKKLKGGEPTKTRSPRQSAPTLFSPPAPQVATVDDMRFVATVIKDNKSSVSGLSDEVARVKGLADKVGGLDNLASSTEALKDLSGLK